MPPPDDPLQPPSISPQDETVNDSDDGGGFEESDDIKRPILRYRRPTVVPSPPAPPPPPRGSSSAWSTGSSTCSTSFGLSDPLVSLSHGGTDYALSSGKMNAASAFPYCSRFTRASSDARCTTRVPGISAICTAFVHYPISLIEYGAGAARLVQAPTVTESAMTPMSIQAARLASDRPNDRTHFSYFSLWVNFNFLPLLSSYSREGRS